MALEVDIVRSAAPSSTGTQDYLSSRLTANPVAAVFWVTSCETNSTNTDNALLSFGATDGGREYCIASGSQNNSGLRNNTYAYGSTNEVVVLQDAFGNADQLASFSAWKNSSGQWGVTINWSAVDAATDNRLVHCMLIGDGGEGDVDARCIAFNTHATQNSASTITQDAVDSTAIGFEPSFVLLWGHGYFTDAKGDDCKISVGAAVNDGSETQGGVRVYEDDFKFTSEPQALHRNDYIPGQVDLSWESVEITGFTSNGFEATTRDNSGNRGWACLCVELPSGDNVGLLNTDTKTTTGVENYSFGFAPDATLIFGSWCVTYGTEETDADAASLSISAGTQDAEYTACIMIEDAQSASDTSSVASDKILWLNEPTGNTANKCQATKLTGSTGGPFDGDGVAMTYADADGTARLLTMLAFGKQHKTVITRSGKVVRNKRVL